MTHGGVAYISNDKVIRLSEDLLKPLSVAEGSQLTAIYYPTPIGEEYESSYQGIARQPDFMLTPIPYNAWPYSAGMRVDIKHKKGSFAEVAAFLREYEINIIMAQCTRSGHRHATWTLVVEFEGLRKDKDLPGLEELRQLSVQVEERAKALKKDLQEACRSAIPNPTNTPYLRNPIGCWPLKGLAYFFEFSQKNPIARPFRALCSSKDTINIKEVSNAAWAEVNDNLPTLGFASMDSDLFNIRIAVLSHSTLKLFRSVSVHYEMDIFPRRSSLGIMHSIASKLSDDWNLWRVYNQTCKKTTTREEGNVHIFAEYTDQKNLKEPELEEDIKQRFKTVSHEFTDLSFSEPIRVSTISPRRIFISMRNKAEFKRHDDILKICQKLSSKIGVLPEDVVTVKTYTAESVTREVIEQIRNCSGMLQFFMGSGPSMEWLSGEFFLACFLKMPCVRFVDPKLHDQLKLQKDHPAKVISMDASTNELSKAIKEALFELDSKMQW